MMGSVLLVGVEPEIAHALKRRSPGLDSSVVNVEDPNALSGMDLSQGPLDAVVLGTALKEPIVIAQSAHRLDRDSSVMILTHASGRDLVVEALRTAPGISGEVRCVAVEDPIEVCRDLSEAIDRARKRRNHRLTLAAVNAQLQTAQPPAPAEVVSLGRLLDYAPAGVCALDEEGRVIVWNLRAERIFEQTVHDVMGRSFTSLLDERALPGWAALQQRTQTRKAAQQLELVRTRKDGSEQYLEITAAPMTPRSGHSTLLLIFQDITERKLNEAERTELLRQTQLALAVRDEFLDVASHELRTPLTSLRIMIQALERDLIALPLPDEQRAPMERKIESSDRQVVRLTRLVEALLDVSSIQSGRLRLERTQVDLSSIAVRLTDELEELAQRAGSSFAVNVVPALKGFWDARRIEQVILQLLHNALRYAPGTVIDVKVFREGEHAALEVSDQGIGIAATDLDRIFSRFERAAPSRNFGGLGLGLFISRHIVEAHGGTLSACSAPGEGATFRILLPVHPG